MDKFFENLSQVLANLPDNRLAIVSLIVLGVSLIGYLFFSKEHVAYRFAAFVLMLLGAAGLVSTIVNGSSDVASLPSDVVSAQIDCGDDENFILMRSEEIFRACIVGRALIRQSDGATISVNADNTISGKFGSQDAKGLWSWTESNGYCRELTIGKNHLDYICVSWNASANKIQIPHANGSIEEWDFIN